MPDESCRTCGGELIKWSRCSDCRKVTQKICRICNLKTVEGFHFHHISLEAYKILETKSTVATIQSYSNQVNIKKHGKNNHNTNQINSTLVVFGIVMGIIFLGVGSMDHLDYSHNSTSTQTKTIPSPQLQNIVSTVEEMHHVDTLQPSESINPTYSNCLGNANGISLTITCPTTYGIVYKAVVDIPSGLIVQFENKVFNVREMSIIEHLNSVSIKYETQTYEAKFVNS